MLFLICSQPLFIYRHRQPVLLSRSISSTSPAPLASRMLASPSQTPEASSSPKIARAHSCVLCQQRKVKCDRQKPCSNCVKARAECIPSVPTLPRRRKRKFSEQDLATKLRRYEFLLKKHGIKVEDEEPNDGGQMSKDRDWYPASKGPKGLMLADSQHSRYVEKYIQRHVAIALY